MLVPQLTRPWSQFIAEQSNQIARCHLSLPDSVSHSDYESPQAINMNLNWSKESTPMKDAGTTVDKTMIPVQCLAIKSNSKLSPLPADSVSHNNDGGPQAKNWISFCQKSQHPQRMLVPQLTRPWFQFIDEQSNQMARCHLSSLILCPATIMKALKQ
jgi:hypothetical protein